MSERINLQDRRDRVKRLRDGISPSHAVTFIEAVEAAHAVTVIEDLYRDLPPELRAGALDAFRPKHREAMDALRNVLARFDFAAPSPVPPT